MSKDSRRRSFFGARSLGALTGLQNSRDDDDPANLLRKRRTASFRTTFSAASTQPADDDSLTGSPALDSPSSPKPTLSRGSQSRPSSVFGSLRGLRRDDGPDEPVSAASTRTFSGNWSVVDDHARNNHVLRHGEVQTSSSMFRKKKEYLVLTESHLLRFKNHQKAADAFSAYRLPCPFSHPLPQADSSKDTLALLSILLVSS